MMGVGAVGSPIDVATFILVLAELRFGRLRDLDDDLAAVGAHLAVVAEDVATADPAQVKADLDVDDRDVAAARRLACDGGDGADA